jgi:Tol biopolymer transport system component
MGIAGVAAVLLVSACAGPPRPPGSGGATTTTTSEPAAPSTTVATPPTTTAPPPSTTTVPASTTTTSPPTPGDSIARLTDGDRDSSSPAISADGQHVAFWSFAVNLVPEDGSTDEDVFVWDRSTGTTTLVTQDARGGHPSISGDGRFVAYHGAATDTVPADVFRWDRTTGMTTSITEGDASSVVPALSADGRYVAFESAASTLVPDDTNGRSDIFVWDASTGAITRVTDGNDESNWPHISADGRFVTFQSSASDLVPDDTNGVVDVFLWDSASGAVTRLTDGEGYSASPRISATGRYVVFNSITPGETNEGHVYMWDAATGETRRVSGGPSDAAPDISGDGRYVTYQSYDSNLVSGDEDGSEDVYLWDAVTGETRRITDGDAPSVTPVISADGGAIAFDSLASDIPEGHGDTNGVRDMFLWSRTG